MVFLAIASTFPWMSFWHACPPSRGTAWATCSKAGASTLPCCHVSPQLAAFMGTLHCTGDFPTLPGLAQLPLQD